MNVTELSGVGAKRAHSLYTAGIVTVTDLLNHFPRDYDDRTHVKTIAELSMDAVNTIRGVVAADAESATLKRKGASYLNITKIIIKDHTGMLELVWFNQPYLKKYFTKNREYIFTGKVRHLYGGRIQMQSPEYEPCNDAELSHGRIVPVYTMPKQFSQKTFRVLIHQALEQVLKTEASIQDNAFAEHLPYTVRMKHSLCERKTAICNIHFPESDGLFLAARRRLVFEELFFIQAALLQMKDATTAQTGVQLSDTNLEPFLRALPFKLTNAQAKVLEEIKGDISTGRRMNRLIQGDVGSGKTAIAMGAAFLAMKNGCQTAFMAPTDVLANQHFTQCETFFTPLGFETVLLTGSISAKARREALAKIESGQAAVIIGTHALIQEKVKYACLGLAITDEQHRFGVNQRLSLTEKSSHPHTLVMTATPIPRTLGMILYGDLDISIVNEMPPGRQTIKTYSVNSSYRQRIHDFIRKEVEQGRQSYIICPAIEARQDENAEDEISQNSNETILHDMKNVTDYTAELSVALPDIKIACLHGKMKAAEKQRIMDDFKNGRINALVSTTVIEVGVHVANATLMIIENAERFGLSQLHQLRGRVGRGQHQSYCVLITDTKNDETKARMKAMRDTSDGFTLAELDLKLRGTGDFFGTRQHGLPSFTIANLYRDINILKEVQEVITAMDKYIIASEEANAIKARIAKVLSSTHGGVM